MKKGNRIRVKANAPMEHPCLRGRVGVFVKTTKPHGFVRIKLDDPAAGTVTKDGTILVHPESLEEMDEKWCSDCGTKMKLVGSIPAQLFVFQCPKCHKEILSDDMEESPTVPGSDDYPDLDCHWDGKGNE